MFAGVRRLLGRVFLRGPLLSWWIARRARQWETAYCAELSASAALPLPPDVPWLTAPAGELRQILLIADCMWEKNDLVPELGRIAPTQVLDLHPSLKVLTDTRALSAAVITAVRQFIEAEPAFSPDVILFYARPALLSDEVFDLLRRRWKCPLLGLNLDDRFEFFPYGIFAGEKDDYQRWAKKFDLNLTNCLPATDWYRRRGLPCLYTPQGVHIPDGLTLPTSSDFKYPLSFLGSKKPEREIIVRQLQNAGVPITLFGAGWPDAQWVENTSAVFRATQINLGIGFATPSLTLTTVKGRDFECPGVGACYLTSYNWELPLHYELGKEILCYRSIEELVEIYSYYRPRPEACLQIAQAAWHRSVAEHTWEKRFREVFRQVGFKV